MGLYIWGGTYESHKRVPPGLSCLSPPSGLCGLGGCPPNLTSHLLPQLQSAGAPAPLGGALQVCWEPQADHRRCQAGLQAQLHCDLREPLPWVPWHPLSRAPFVLASGSYQEGTGKSGCFAMWKHPRGHVWNVVVSPEERGRVKSTVLS